MDGFLLTIKNIYNKEVKKILRKVLIKNLQDIFIVLTPFVLLLILLGVRIADEKIVQHIKENKLFSVPFTLSQAPYPHISNMSNSFLYEDSTSFSAQAFIVLDNDSKVMLLSKNEKEIFPMASTTKIMTALVSLDHYKLDDVITIKDTMVSGAVVGFPKEEKVYVKDLLYALLLPSGNDAAIALAQNYSGGEGAFISQMNKIAKDLYLSNTFFKDPTGLSENNITTALELARLTSIALRNNIFANVVSTKNTSISNVDKTKIYSLTNINKLLGIHGVNGVKTGFTDEAGEVLVTSRLEDGHTIIIVIMKSKDRFLDTQHLLSFLKGNIEYLILTDPIVSTHP